MPSSALFQGLLQPKEFDKIELLSTPAKPTKIVWKQSGVVLRELKLTYEVGTENLESIEVVI